MILSISQDMVPCLRDAHHFKSFHLEVLGRQEQKQEIEAALDRSICFDGEGHAWVSAQMLRTMTAVHADAAWQTAFDSMIVAARPHGWIRDEPRLEIKAHVIWL